MSQLLVSVQIWLAADVGHQQGLIHKSRVWGRLIRHASSHPGTARRNSSISARMVSIESRGQACLLSQHVVGRGDGQQTAGPGDLWIVNRRASGRFRLPTRSRWVHSVGAHRSSRSCLSEESSRWGAGMRRGTAGGPVDDHDGHRRRRGVVGLVAPWS
jgi:hypothetical protein